MLDVNKNDEGSVRVSAGRLTRKMLFRRLLRDAFDRTRGGRTSNGFETRILDFGLYGDPALSLPLRQEMFG